MSFTSSTTRRGSNNKGGGAFGGFIAGVLMICIALPMVWMNERREVHQYKLIKAA